MKEKNWIEHLKLTFNPGGDICGIGDDAALLSKAGFEVITIDTLCEGTHFHTGTAPALIGQKCVNVSLSDCAAMGAKPKAVLVSLGVPAGTSSQWIKALYRGIEKALNRFGVDLIGGDTVRSRQIVVSSVGIGGLEPGKPAIPRAHSKTGDSIYTTGCFGYSLTTGHHLKFLPRVDEILWLRERVMVNSLTDASDGLARSLELVLSDHHGACIDLKQVCVRSVHSPKIRDFEHALFDGEDFELVFTASDISTRIQHSFEKKFGCPLRKIGEVAGKNKPRISFELNGKTVKFKLKPFEHF